MDGFDRLMKRPVEKPDESTAKFVSIGFRGKLLATARALRVSASSGFAR